METTTEGSTSKFAIPDVLFWLVMIILVVLLLYLLVGLYFVYQIVADGLERRRMRRVGAFRPGLAEPDPESGTGQAKDETTIVRTAGNEEKTKETKMIQFKNEISTSLEYSQNAVKKTMKKIYGTESKEAHSSSHVDTNGNTRIDVNYNVPKSGQTVANNNSILVYAAAMDDDPDPEEDETEFGDDDETEAETEYQTEAPSEAETPYPEAEDEPIQQEEAVPENTMDIDDTAQNENLDADEGGEEEADEDAIMDDVVISREPNSKETINEVGFEVINPASVMATAYDDEAPLVEDPFEEAQEEAPEEAEQEVPEEEDCDPDEFPEKKCAGALSLLEFAQTEGGWNRQKVTNPEAEKGLKGGPHTHPSDQPGRHFTLPPFLQPLQDFVESLAMSAPQSATSMILQTDGNENDVPVVFDTEEFDDNDQTAIRDEMDRLTRERSVGAITLLDFMQAEGSDWRYQSGAAERPDPTKKKRRKCSEIAREKRLSGQVQTQTIYMAEKSASQGSRPKVQSVRSIGERAQKSQGSGLKVASNKSASGEDRRRSQKSSPEIQNEEAPLADIPEGDEYGEFQETQDETDENGVAVDENPVDESLVSEANVDLDEMVYNAYNEDDYPEESIQEVPEYSQSATQPQQPCTDEVTINANQAGTNTSVVQPCGGPATITINLNIQTGCPDDSTARSGRKTGYNDNITRATEGAYPDCEPCDRLFAENRTPYPVVKEIEIGSDQLPGNKGPRYCDCKPQFNEEENLEMCKSFGAMTLLDYMQAEGSAYGHNHNHGGGGTQNSNFDRVRTQIASWWDSAKTVAGINTSTNPEFSGALDDDCDPNPADEPEPDAFQRVSKSKSNERRKSEKEYEELRTKSKAEGCGPIENEYTRQVVKMSEEENTGRKVCRTQGHDEQVRSNYERDLNSRSGERR